MLPSDAIEPSVGPPVFPYGSAAAFCTALRDRFAAIAKADTRYSLDELQRQFAHDRALARLLTSPDADSRVLKDAGALLARLEQARHSKDIDVYFAEQAVAVSDAISALRGALSCDLSVYSGSRSPGSFRFGMRPRDGESACGPRWALKSSRFSTWTSWSGRR